MQHLYCRSQNVLSQIAFLMLALALPCTAFSLAESTLWEIAELAEEDGKEYTAVSEFNRFRRRRHLSHRIPPASHVANSVQKVQQNAGSTRIVGHRMANGLLAPLRC
jgi:hypothetical protein